jgi:stage III sporulation protein AB
MSAEWVPMAKLLGSVLVVAAGAYGGFGLAGRLESELKELERLEVALLCLSSEISYSLTPLPAALQSAGKRSGGVVGALFCRFGALTGLSQRRTAAEALEMALAEAGKKVAAPARELLKELAVNLGTSGHKEQERYIEMSLSKARGLRQEFEGECRKRAKLYRYLGVFGGACVAIVLL